MSHNFIRSLVDIINQPYYNQQQNFLQFSYYKNKIFFEYLLRKLIAIILNSIPDSEKPVSYIEDTSLSVNIEPDIVSAYVPCHMDTQKISNLYFKHLREYLQLSANSILNNTLTEFEKKLLELSYVYIATEDLQKVSTDYNCYYQNNNCKLLRLSFNETHYDNGFIIIQFTSYDNFYNEYHPNNIMLAQNNMFVTRNTYSY